MFVHVTKDRASYCEFVKEYHKHNYNLGLNIATRRTLLDLSTKLSWNEIVKYREFLPSHFQASNLLFPSKAMQYFCKVHYVSTSKRSLEGTDRLIRQHHALEIQSWYLYTICIKNSIIYFWKPCWPSGITSTCDPKDEGSNPGCAPIYLFPGCAHITRLTVFPSGNHREETR